jgi:hypothetical protein
MGRTGDRGETAVYDLAIENNGAAAVDVLLSGGGEGCDVMVPPTAMAAPRTTTHARVLVRAPRRRWLGQPLRRRFSVEARQQGGGPPLGSADGQFDDLPDPRGRMAVLGIGGVAIAGVVAAILAVSGAFGGGDSPAVPTRSATATRTATRTPSATASSSATGSATSSATTTTTATATGEGVPARSISANEWDYTFTVASNSCGGDPLPGRAFSYAYTYTEQGSQSDGYITDRELVKVSQLTDSGSAAIGDFVFSWPVFQFSYFIEGGKATLVNSFTDESSGSAELTEAYTLPNGDTCSIYMKDG